MKRFFLYINLILFFSSIAAHSDDIFTVTEEFPPYNYELNGRLTGVSTEVVQAVFREAGIGFNIKLYPWARAYKMALENKTILIYSILRTPDRENLFKWVGTIAPRKSYFYKLKTRKDIMINALENARHYIVGGVIEDARVNYLKNNGFNVIETVTRDELNIRKLYAGRIELMICNEFSFAYLVKSINFKIDDFEKAFLLEEFSKGDFYMAFSRTTSDELVDKLKTALDKIKSNGTYDSILTNYFNKLE